MLKMFKKALIIAIAIVVVQWAWRHLKEDDSTKELLEKLKKITNG